MSHGSVGIHVALCQEHEDRITERLNRHSAVLFRGWFAQEAVCLEPARTTRGSDGATDVD